MSFLCGHHQSIGSEVDALREEREREKETRNEGKYEKSVAGENGKRREGK